MSPSRGSLEDRRLLSPHANSTEELEGYDREALSDLNDARPLKRGWRTRSHLFGIFRVLAWFIVLAAAAIIVEAYSLGFLSASFTSIDGFQPGKLKPEIAASEPTIRPPLPAHVRYAKPVGPKIIGLVFYGRRDRAVVLECYLKQNLVINGGWLDEVIWGVNTDNADDKAYLEAIVSSSPLYRRLDLQERGYVNLWNRSVEYGNVYIKIDDDVVYIHQDTIPRIVHTLTTDSRAVAVSANVINSPEYNWVHYRIGAIRPYLPEFQFPTAGSLSTLENPLWKVSSLPSWSGPEGWASPLVGEFTKEVSRRMPPKVHGEEAGVLPRHRWLPLDDPLDISRTPIAQSAYDPFGRGWTSWAIAAQQHYSFFYQLETGQLSAYYMNHGFGENASAIWDHTGDRLSINLLAVMGDTIRDNMENIAAAESDEAYLTVDLPRQLNKRLLVHTQALASHYAFRTQETLNTTDILSRYRAYADEKICRGDVVPPE